MSKKIDYLIIVVFLGFLIPHTLAQDELRDPAEQRMLLDRHVLSGIKNFAVEIVPIKNSSNIDAPPWNELPEKVKQKFDQAQIEIILRHISHEQPNASILPVLQICIDTLQLADTSQYVFHIQTVFKTKVRLHEKPLRYIKADVWKTKPVMKAVSSKNMPTQITNEILKQVEEFICAYHAADTQNTDASNNNSLMTEQAEAPSPKQAKTSVLNQLIQTRFVASKNSKVFHKPECQWAQKIKTQNLIVYNNRDQAINDGKRPCKMCKP